MAGRPTSAERPVKTAIEAAYAPLTIGPLKLRNRFIKSATN